jgi:hypothetical protein
MSFCSFDTVAVSTEPDRTIRYTGLHVRLSNFRLVEASHSLSPRLVIILLISVNFHLIASPYSSSSSRLSRDVLHMDPMS